MTTRRRIDSSVVALLLATATAAAQLPELRELDLRNWECLSQLEGAARTEDGKERNRQKNRSPAIDQLESAAELDIPAFLARAAEYDQQIGRKHRRDLDSAAKEKLATLENKVISLTGWLVLAYQGVPETTNCRSKDFLDWHLELSAQPADHAAQVGDPTPIICEITPRTQTLLFQNGARMQKLAAFFRLPDNSFAATGNRAHKIRVTGYLLWDDEHNKAESDVGDYIAWFSDEGYHHPWRRTAWEIHPVVKIEDLGSK
jgi:hypothetical protein